MKKNILTLFLFITSFVSSQVGIGTNNPHTSAALDLSSTTKGLLLPRLTKIQMENISSPAEGLMVFCTDCVNNKIYVFNGLSFGVINEVTSSNGFSITKFPTDFKVYKRDKSTNTSIVDISGYISPSLSISSVILEVYRNNILISSFSNTLSAIDSNGNFHFNFSPSINAELANYKFILKTDTNIVLQEANNVVSGDIYIVTGQSNSVYYNDYPSVYSYSNDYIRTIGNTENFTTTLTIINPLGVGGIGYKFAVDIVTNNNIPVLVLNGGDGGKPISFFQRDEINKFNGSTNYGKLLKRYTSVGYEPTDVTAIIWYQGEADGSSLTLTDYNTLFNYLYLNWEEDYTPEHYYVFQVHKGCGVNINSQIPEAHRQLGLENSNITTISTNGALQGSDNCHYLNTNGYNTLGERLYNLLNFKYYNSSNNSGIFSPDIINVKYGNSTKTLITFDLIPETDAFIIGSGVENDFIIENTINPTTIVGISISGNSVTLQLSNSGIGSDTKLTYIGRNQDEIPYIFNQNNIGMLSFKGIPISSF
jgi:hypothetical protein